ncbi:MAG: hypothetical protein WD425_21325 [Nitrospirales bacterium]
MSDIMTIRRSCEEGMYLLPEGDCLWRMNDAGEIECAAQMPPRLLELLYFLQEWITPSRRRFLNYPLHEWSDRKRAIPFQQE